MFIPLQNILIQFRPEKQDYYLTLLSSTISKVLTATTETSVLTITNTVITELIITNMALVLNTQKQLKH